MQKITSIKALTLLTNKWRQSGEYIALVPTLGNIHKGHIKCVNDAKKQADKVVVSIFVNPTQFSATEDFAAYPRTATADEAQLIRASTDLLFLPSTQEMYHKNFDTLISAGKLSKLYCGASRDGHFDGVATIVSKLFNIVQPHIAVFGEKDFQQLLMVRNLVHDLNIPVKIFSVKTQREDDGLAISSRNNYLTKKQRLVAPKLYQSLLEAHTMVLLAKQKLPLIEQQQKQLLQNLGFKVDYFSICRSNDLQNATDIDNELVILVAARLGKSRLIDNICFTKQGG